MSGYFPSPSPPRKKAAASGHKAGQASTGDGAGDESENDWSAKGVDKVGSVIESDIEGGWIRAVEKE